MLQIDDAMPMPVAVMMMMIVAVCVTVRVVVTVVMSMVMVVAMRMIMAMSMIMSNTWGATGIMDVAGIVEMSNDVAPDFVDLAGLDGRQRGFRAVRTSTIHAHGFRPF
ncbi:MAG: hypothetical protein ACRCS9_03720 [Hyphomicrobium sp.]